MLKNTEKRIRAGALALAALVLSGCAHGSADGEGVVILEQEEQTNYTLGAVTVEDVVLTHTIRLEYRQVNDEQLGFALDGREIARVYVEKGDAVEKGQILAELVTDSIDADIENLEYQISRNRLMLAQASESMDMEIRLLNRQYAGYEQTQETKDALADAVAGVRNRYRYKTEDYEDALSVENMRLEKLQEEKGKAYLRAGMAGTVSYVKDDIEGEYSKEGEVVIKLIDDSHCVFVAKDGEYAEYFPEGSVTEMTIGSETYELVPYMRDTWGDEFYLTLADENENIELDVGRSGQITLTLEERDQVLAVSKEAVHEADGKAFLYVLGDGGVREVKWIGIGLKGDVFVEITEGLQEGDKVVLK